MKDFTANIPEIVAEVRDLFERYETALETKDVAVLDDTFWNSPHTIRYALHENGYGFDAIHQHEADLLEYATQRLSEIDGLRIYGPANEHKGPIISFTVEGTHAEDLAQLLNLRGVFVRHGHHCTMPLHKKLGIDASVRASFAMYNNKSDVDALCESLKLALNQLRKG